MAVAGALVALAIPAWRRRPALAAPALLATLPWWPVPLPSIALVWTGPLAWLPIGLASLAALFDEIARRPPESLESRAAPYQARTWRVAAALTLAVGIAGGWSLSPRIPQGDEMHYLVITQSLLKDGDLRIENNHRARDYAAYYDKQLAPDVIQRGRDGQIYSIHAPGLSVLVLPAFWLFGYRGAQATVLLLAALAAGLIWKIGWRATGSATAAWFAWAALTGSITFVIQSATVFPDVPAALIVAGATYVLLAMNARDGSWTPGGPALAAVGTLLACLPWLHTRFAVLSAGFGGLIVWSILRDHAAPAFARSRRLAWFLSAPVVGATCWFAFFQLLYGTPNPAAPYGARPEVSLAFIPGGLAGLFFDQQFGLIAYAPVLAAALAGIVLARPGPTRWTSLATTAVALLYLAVVATYWMWYAGVPATPARFATAVLPAFAIPLARSWAVSGVFGRTTLAMLLGLSLAFTVVVIGVDFGRLTWNVRGNSALWLEWLGPVVDLARGWPSFFWRLSPEDLSTEIPYFVHVFAWLAVVAAIAAAGRLVVRRTSRAVEAASSVTVWSVALGLMALVQTGWWLNGVPGSNPARSQIALLEARRDGQSVMRIASFSIGRVADLAGTLRIRPVDPARPGSAMSGAIRGLPAGTYEFRVATARPRQGELAIRIGSAVRPWRTLTVLPLSRQAFVVTLPADVAELTFVPDAGLTEIGGTVELTPLAIRPDANVHTLSVVRFGGTDVFFLDQDAFVEDTGFWVQGGRATEVVMAAGAGRPSVPLTLRNGSAPNTVRLQTDGELQTLPLRPDEERSVSIPVAADGVVRLRISSESGFRPSDAPNGDQRFLGVWVRIGQ